MTQYRVTMLTIHTQITRLHATDTHYPPLTTNGNLQDIVHDNDVVVVVLDRDRVHSARNSNRIRNA